MRFLAADIGGSQARLLIGETTGPSWRVVRQETLPSREFASLDELLHQVLATGEPPSIACLALAGPVEGSRARMTNLPWQVDAADLARRHHFKRIHLLNDFAAQAHGLPGLTKDDYHTLQAGQPVADGPRLLLGAGTGLGMALRVGGENPLVLASEGGHGDFAPADPQQIALLHYLLPQFGRVSLEHLLSGHGLERLHGFLAGAPAGEPPLLTASALSGAALAGEPLAVGAVALFARIYASAAGNLALTLLPRGGVYLCGGIAPRILPFLTTPEALAAFCHKPPMEALLAQIPLHVVTDQLLGLQGAARVAAGLARHPD